MGVHIVSAWIYGQGQTAQVRTKILFTIPIPQPYSKIGLPDCNLRFRKRDFSAGRLRSSEEVR
jgi:hypothetical protein